MSDDILNWIKQQKNSESDESDELDESDEAEPHTRMDIKRYDIVYEWEQMEVSWVKKLLSNNFYKINCIGDGNCQFRAIATALLDFNDISRKMTHMDIREVIAKYVRKLNIIDFRNILDLYKIEYNNKEFRGEWNPLKIKTKKEFVTNLLNGGFHFEGDNITLSILSNALGIDFIILDNDNMNIIDLSNKDRKHKYIVILLYGDNHYQTVGYKYHINGKIESFFERKNLPGDIKLILDKYKLLYKHCEILSKSGKKLNNIFRELQDNCHIKLDTNDKKIVCKYINKCN